MSKNQITAQTLNEIATTKNAELDAQTLIELKDLLAEFEEHAKKGHFYSSVYRPDEIQKLPKNFGAALRSIGIECSYQHDSYYGTLTGIQFDWANKPSKPSKNP